MSDGDKRKSRRWCVTFNGAGPADVPHDLSFLPQCRYFVGQFEAGDATHREHIQGYVEFERDHDLRWIKNNCGRWGNCHWEIAHGDAAANKLYCSKESTRIHREGFDSGPWEFGTVVSQGRRTDLESVGRAVLDAGRVDVAPLSYQIRFPRGLALLAGRAPGKFRDDLVVVCIHGPSEIGKSFAVYDGWGEYGICTAMYGNTGTWIEHYHGEPILFIDEFAGQMPIGRFKQLLDPYSVSVDAKGGSCRPDWHLVFVCTNTDPADWYSITIGRPGDPGTRSRLDEVHGVWRRIGYGEFAQPRKDATAGRRGHYIDATDREDLNKKLDLIDEHLPAGLHRHAGWTTRSRAGYVPPVPAPPASESDDHRVDMPDTAGCSSHAGPAAAAPVGRDQTSDGAPLPDRLVQTQQGPPRQRRRACLVDSDEEEQAWEASEDEWIGLEGDEEEEMTADLNKQWFISDEAEDSDDPFDPDLD